jgi:hypothetical protein
VQSKDISKGPGRRVGNLKLCRFVAPGRPAEPPDQGIEVTIFHAVDAAEIGDDPVPRFACLVAVGLDDLQVAPPAALVDAHEHAYIILMPNQQYNSLKQNDV